MINKLNRPNLGRLAGRLFSGNASRADEAPPLEVAPEIQVLAARITELLAMGDHPQSLTPEQQAQWGHVKAPFSLMYTRYNISRVYHTWRRSPEDAGARQAFQSTLLGVLTTDAELLDKFNAALPPPVPEWIAPDEETLAAEHAAPTLPVQPELPIESQSELLVEPHTAPGPEPLEETQPAPQSETPAAAGRPAPRTGFDDLVRELWTDEDFYRIVYALRYSNPSLFNLTARLADEPKLSGELEAFFTKSELGRQLVKKSPREE